MEGRCYCCGIKGHISPDYRKKKKIPGEEWVINKAQQHANVKNEQSEAYSGSLSSDSKITTKKEQAQDGWSGMHVSFAQTANLKDLILLDSDSTDTVFCNSKYMTNIRDSNTPLDILTNGGPITTKQKCTVPYLGKVWYNENSMTNIISRKDMNKKYRVTMDSKEEKAFLVHLPNKIVRFKEHSNGLYARNPNDSSSITYKIKNTCVKLLQTLEENEKFVSPRQ